MTKGTTKTRTRGKRKGSSGRKPEEWPGLCTKDFPVD